MSDIVALHQDYRPHLARLGEAIEAVIMERWEQGPLTAEEVVGALEIAKMHFLAVMDAEDE